MNMRKFLKINWGIPIGIIVGTLITVAISQDKKSPDLIKQETFLAEVPFNKVVLYALIAAERNYQFKKRLIPLVNENDYFTVILNTAKRLAMADSVRVTLPGLKKAAKADSTKKE